MQCNLKNFNCHGVKENAIARDYAQVANRFEKCGYTSSGSTVLVGYRPRWPTAENGACSCTRCICRALISVGRGWITDANFDPFPGGTSLLYLLNQVLKVTAAPAIQRHDSLLGAQGLISQQQEQRQQRITTTAISSSVAVASVLCGYAVSEKFIYEKLQRLLAARITATSAASRCAGNLRIYKLAGWGTALL